MGQQTEVDPDLLKIWSERLENQTVSPLTRDYPEAGQGSAKVPVDAFESLSSTDDVAQSLKSISNGATSPFSVLQAAFIVLVSRLTGDEDISIGTNSSRDGKAFVLRTPLTPADKFSEILTKTAKVRPRSHHLKHD